MGYDLTLLAKSTDAVALPALAQVLDDYRFEVVESDGQGWTQVLVTSPSGDEICMLERASPRTMAREVADLLEDLADREPRSGAVWVGAYLRGTRAVYGCSLLSFGFARAYAGVPSGLLWAIQSILGGGILHVEGQGYANEDGYQITWEFSDRAKGARQMAVLGSAGHWHAFEMELGDETSRQAFRAGTRPFGAELLVLH